MNLELLGWHDFFAESFPLHTPDRYSPGRVCRAARGVVRLLTAAGEVDARLSGKLHSENTVAVGDWVLWDPATETVEAALPRRTEFARKKPGAPTQKQVLAANVDVVWIVTGLDGDFSLRRLERYLVLVSESGARPVVVLNKSDLCLDPAAALREARPVAAGAPVVLVSALSGMGLDDLAQHIDRGETGALIGSSGAGKSTLINGLLGYEAQIVQPVIGRDGRGRHTTTHRELILMPAGWLLMDLPGLREVQLWASEDAVGQTFAEVTALAERCRFRDCRHQGEPGCAVEAALRDGVLEPGRLESYHKLQKELSHLRTKQDEGAALEQKRLWKRIHKMHRKTPRPRP
jgi:ribosome biogenesis GTPase